MSTQQDIYAASSENRPPMLNKDNYVPWSSRLLRYSKSDPDHEVPVAKTFHEQTDNEQTEKEEIWLHVRQMMKGSDIGIQDKKAKLFNEWERFTSTDEESIKSYYHRFSKLMNDFQRNKHFPEKIASNLKQRQISQSGMNMGQDRQRQMVGGNGRNPFRQYAGQNVRNQNRYNALQNFRNQVVQNAI
ncbi:hypothetical protein Tco_0316240 [Tanacetum coccineum]